MYNYIFYGTVFPIDSDVNANDIRINGKTKFKGTEVFFNAKIEIEHSKIKVICETDLANFPTIRNSIKGALQGILNQLSFTTNCFMQVLLEKAINEDYKQEITGVLLNSEIIAPEKHENNLTIHEMFKVNTPQISTALNNFRLARENPQDTAFFCFRAIEAIKNDFKGKDEKENWERMRANLNLTKEYINKFKDDHADPQRHGVAILETHGEDRLGQLESAWIIINRYLNYCKNNNQKLDEKDFPIL